MGGGFFEVIPEQLEAVANLLRESAEDLRATLRTWDGQTRDGSAAFGVAETSGAFATVQQALFERITKQADNIAGLGDNASASAGTYRSSDETAAESFGGGAWL